MKVYLYNNKFFVGPDLFHQLKEDGYEEWERQEILNFFCPSCCKEKPRLKVKTGMIELIGGRRDRGSYVLNDTFWLTKELFKEILTPQYSKEHINTLICRLQMGEVIELGESLLFYYEPEIIDYQEVVAVINEYLNEDPKEKWKRDIDYLMDLLRKEKEAREYIEELQKQPIIPHIPFEEPPWPQYPNEPYNPWWWGISRTNDKLYYTDRTSALKPSDVIATTTSVEEEKEKE